MRLLLGTVAGVLLVAGIRLAELWEGRSANLLDAGPEPFRFVPASALDPDGFDVDVSDEWPAGTRVRFRGGTRLVVVERTDAGWACGPRGAP